MVLRRSILCVLATAALTAGFVPVIAAGQTAPASFAVSPWSLGHPQQSETAAGIGFPPAATVRLSFDGKPTGSTSSDAQGSWTAKFVVPASALPGTHWVAAVSGAVKVKRQFTVRTNWLASGFSPRHAGLNPYENVLSTVNVSALHQLWSTSPNPSGDNNAQLGESILVNGVLYTSDYDPENSDGLNYAIDASTGKVLWTYPEGNAVGAPAVDGTTLYTISPDGVLVAQNIADGSIEWSMASPGRSIVGINNGVLYTQGPTAIDLAMHKVLWQGTVGDAGGDAYDPQAGVVIYGGNDSRIHAISAEDGTELWSYPSIGLDSHMPSISGGVVYMDLGGPNPDMVALNETDGSLIWDHSHLPIFGAPAAADGKVFIESGGHIEALNAADGSLVWTATPLYGDGGSGVAAPIVVANGVVYAMPFTTLDESTGSILFQSPPAGNVSLIVANGDVYLNSSVTSIAEYAAQ